MNKYYKNKSNNKSNHQSGFILVLSILIIGAVVGTVAIFSNLIIRGIIQSRVINNSIQAYYLAESASEKVLHQVRRRQAIIDCNAVDINSDDICNVNGFCTDNTNVPCVNFDKGTLDITDNWEVIVLNEMATSFNLKEAGSFQIDLFSPIQNSSSNIKKIRIESSEVDLILLVELTNLTKILNVSQSSCWNQPPVFKLIADLGSNDNYDISSQILEECSYSLKLKYPLAGGGKSASVTITVFDSSGDQLPIPSRLIINSKAKFGQSQQELQVRTPIRPPVSELYDFVIFSEEKISK